MSNIPETYQPQDDGRPDHHSRDHHVREHIGTFGYLVSCVREAEKRRILAAMVNHEGMTYDQLNGVTGVSRRRTRDRVYELRDDDIFEVTDSHVAFVRFTDQTTRRLAEDALAAYFDR